MLHFGNRNDAQRPPTRKTPHAEREGHLPEHAEKAKSRIHGGNADRGHCEEQRRETTVRDNSKGQRRGTAARDNSKRQQQETTARGNGKRQQQETAARGSGKEQRREAAARDSGERQQQETAARGSGERQRREKNPPTPPLRGAQPKAHGQRAIRRQGSGRTKKGRKTGHRKRSDMKKRFTFALPQHFSR